MKKPIVIILSGILLGLLGAGSYLWYSKGKEKPATVIPTPSVPEKIAIEYATWKDPLGVSFSYPADARVNKHDEDKENYMHVEITSATHSGGLVLWAKDLPKGVYDNASWTRVKLATTSGVTIDTTLEKTDAKKILFGSNRVLIGAMYDGLLFEIDATLDEKEYWKYVLEAVVSSFKFYPIETTSSTSQGSSSGGDVSAGVAEEEVLE